MNAYFSITNGSIHTILDEEVYRPDPKEAAALAKTLGRQMGTKSTMSEFEVISIFKTIYASMVTGYMEVKDVHVTQELEDDSSDLALQLAQEVQIDVQKDPGQTQGTPMQKPLPNFLQPGYDPADYLPESGRYDHLYREDVPNYQQPPSFMRQSTGWKTIFSEEDNNRDDPHGPNGGGFLC